MEYASLSASLVDCFSVFLFYLTVEKQRLLEEELTRQKEAERAEARVALLRRAASGDRETYNKLAMLGVFLLAALMIIFHHSGGALRASSASAAPAPASSAM